MLLSSTRVQIDSAFLRLKLSFRHDIPPLSPLASLFFRPAFHPARFSRCPCAVYRIGTLRIIIPFSGWDLSLRPEYQKYGLVIFFENISLMCDQLTGSRTFLLPNPFRQSQPFSNQPGEPPLFALSAAFSRVSASRYPLKTDSLFLCGQFAFLSPENSCFSAPSP